MLKNELIAKIETCYNYKKNGITLNYGINDDIPVSRSVPKHITDDILLKNDIFSLDRIQSIPKWVWDNCELLYGIILITH